MKFKPYESKPITRMAFQITEHMGIEDVDELDPSQYAVFEGPEHDMQIIYFKAYTRPVVGDWVVQLSKEDTYHVTDAVFRERNIV